MPDTNCDMLTERHLTVGQQVLRDGVEGQAVVLQPQHLQPGTGRDSAGSADRVSPPEPEVAAQAREEVLVQVQVDGGQLAGPLRNIDTCVRFEF